MSRKRLPRRSFGDTRGGGCQVVRSGRPGRGRSGGTGRSACAVALRCQRRCPTGRREPVRAVLDGEGSTVRQEGTRRVAEPVEPFCAGGRGSKVATYGRRVASRGEEGGKETRGYLLAVSGRYESEADEIGLEDIRDLTEDDGNPGQHLRQNRRYRRRLEVRVRRVLHPNSSPHGRATARRLRRALPKPTARRAAMQSGRYE